MLPQQNALPKDSPTSIDDQSVSPANTNKQRRRIKFGGPVKILVFESKAEYCRIVWCSIGLGMSQVLIGANLMALLLYTVDAKDKHVVLCGLAYHFFSAEAMLTLNYANGWSTPMHFRHRRLVHGLLQLCALLCAVIGTRLIILSKGFSLNAHGVTGLTTLALSIISSLTGPLALFRRRQKCIKIIHMSFGISTFLMSSISMCFGFVTTAFKRWAEPSVIYLLTSFVVFYTTFIVVASFMKCMMRI